MQVLEEASAASQGRSRGGSTPRTIPANASRGAIAAGIFGLVFAVVIGIVVSGLIVVFTTWFDSNAKALAAIPNITTEKSSSLPPTDPNHIVLVSQTVATYKGQQVLGSNGQNLGSAYGIDPTSYTLQSINHHLYYVAPLSYNNLFVNLSNPRTPGFVVVDAENPQTVPLLYTDQTRAGSSMRRVSPPTRRSRAKSRQSRERRPRHGAATRAPVKSYRMGGSAAAMM